MLEPPEAQSDTVQGEGGEGGVGGVGGVGGLPFFVQVAAVPVKVVPPLGQVIVPPAVKV